MSYGTVQIGRLTLREDRDTGAKINAQTGGVTLVLTGQQSSPNYTTAQLEQQMQDIMSFPNSIVPVVFTEKTALNGYYTVADWAANQSKYVTDGANLIPWSMTLDMLGTDYEVDIESRLGGALTRSNGYALSTGERWHCPPFGAYGYYAGAAVPNIVTRTGADGALTVYRSITFGAYPRWGCPVASYGLGRVRFMATGVERTGISFKGDATNWELNNSLVRIKPLAAGGVLEISAWTGAAWQVKNYDVLANAASLGVLTGISLIQNDYHRVTVRLLKTVAALGRVTVDITLRRGSRFAEIYIQSSSSTTLKFMRSTTEAGTQAVNLTFIKATAADGAGNKYVMGSAGTYTADAANGALSKAAVVSLDVMIGVEVTAAPAGDVAADLYNQYLGTPSELVTAVRR